MPIHRVWLAMPAGTCCGCAAASPRTAHVLKRLLISSAHGGLKLKRHALIRTASKQAPPAGPSALQCMPGQQPWSRVSTRPTARLRALFASWRVSGGPLWGCDTDCALNVTCGRHDRDTYMEMEAEWQKEIWMDTERLVPETSGGDTETSTQRQIRGGTCIETGT